MVIFDVLASHHAMARWHAERLQQRPPELAALREARHALQARLAAAQGSRAVRQRSRFGRAAAGGRGGAGAPGAC